MRTSANAPDPQDIRQMVRDIWRVYGERRGTEGALYMKETGIYEVLDRHGLNCGTVACFAGWYYVSQDPNPVLNEYGIWLREESAGGGTPFNLRVGYEQGKDLIASALGYSTGMTTGKSYALTDWAWSNPHLWGNYRGAHMFTDLMSYNFPEEVPPALADELGIVFPPDNTHYGQGMNRVLLHWLAVADRIEAARA